MKKLVSFFLAVLMLLALCACEKSTETAVDGKKAAETETPAVSVTPEVEVTEEPITSAAPENKSGSAAVTLIDADSTGFSIPQDKICVLDAEGIKIRICFGIDVSEVTLREAVYDDDLNYTGTGSIYAAFGSIAAGGEVGLRVYIPDVVPNVILCYRDASGQHSYGIFQSGRDGSLFLLEMQVAAGFN